ncbi:MAG TPA: CPBP family intramembrane glutamic endopeptidase, partial [Terriglobales bacterium]
MEPTPPPTKLGVALRVGFFILVEIAGLSLFGFLLSPFGLLIASSMGTFAAAAVANALVLRIYERGQLNDIGLGWTTTSYRHLVLGIAGGAGAALAVLLIPLLVRAAWIERVPGDSFQPGSLFFVTLVLLFGAIGEEMLFRGYGFQVLMAALGPWATILPTSVLFAVAHWGNQNASTMGMVNTMGWGVLLGCAFLRSGGLWLPIGLHVGWNWTLPLFGVNLSGFTMGVTGYVMRWRVGALWSGGDYGPEASILTSVALVA